MISPALRISESRLPAWFYTSNDEIKLEADVSQLTDEERKSLVDRIYSAITDTIRAGQQPDWWKGDVPTIG